MTIRSMPPNKKWDENYDKIFKKGKYAPENLKGHPDLIEEVEKMNEVLDQDEGDSDG